MTLAGDDDPAPVVIRAARTCRCYLEAGKYTRAQMAVIPSGKNNGLGFVMPSACILPCRIGFFQGAPIPSNETYRLQVLRRLRVLDTVSADSININGFTIPFRTRKANKTCRLR